MENSAIDKKINNVINLMKENDPDVNTELVLKAYELAKSAHNGQKRMSGEDYIIHPVSVAYILAELKMDTETVVAALLHDVIEDTDLSYDDVCKKFSTEIADLVDGVTKIGKLDFQSKEENQAENFRKMVLAMADDIRVVIIKLVDRLHNMRTLEYMREQKQVEKARETLDIYAPLANRLGIQTVKAELEDLSLKYLDPQGYSDLVKRVKLKKKDREERIDKFIFVITKKLESEGVKAKVYGRSKHFYSIYKKMKQQNRQFDEIYDLMAVRIIVNTVADCYAAFGIVNTMWSPISERFKDFIGKPKSNFYQSLHTTVIGPEGELFEVQIRTKEMHEIAEYGVATHWKYKEGKANVTARNRDKIFEDQMSWIRQILDWHKELGNAKELTETIKVDLLKEVVYVLTPKGKSIELPMGSCPIDFAYRIHSDVGNRCVGAKVNGKMVPLSYTLKNGDIVEVMTSKGSPGPSRDWQDIVKSAHAKNKIKHFFREEKKEENIAVGKTRLEDEVKRLGLQKTKLLNNSTLDVMRKKFGYTDTNDFYAALGYQGIKVKDVVKKMAEFFPEEFPQHEEKIVLSKPTRLKKSTKDIIVAGESNIDVHLSKCCNPVPGDKIMGYITVGRGISVHRTDCSNVLNMKDPKRIIELEWNKFGYGSTYKAELQIKAQNTQGITIAIQNVFVEKKIKMTGISAIVDKDDFSSIRIAFEVKTKREISLLINSINNIREVVSVHRV